MTSSEQNAAQEMANRWVEIQPETVRLVAGGGRGGVGVAVAARDLARNDFGALIPAWMRDSVGGAAGADWPRYPGGLGLPAGEWPAGVCWVVEPHLLATAVRRDVETETLATRAAPAAPARVQRLLRVPETPRSALGDSRLLVVEADPREVPEVDEALLGAF
jgi:hypothetical protein